MIHDAILSCLYLHSNELLMEEFLISDAVSRFFHPCEKKILEDIIEIVHLLRDIAKFTKIYGTNQSINVSTICVDTDEPLQSGLYLKAFANGIEDVLNEYICEVVDLENSFLHNSNNKSLLFIYKQLQKYEPLSIYLIKLIRGIRMQKIHGCAIVQYLQQNSLHGDARICRAIKTIQINVNRVFLKQLTHWILYAKVSDTYGEFFIQCGENHSSNNSTLESERCGRMSSGSEKRAASSISEIVSNYADIWRYEICYELLPHYLSFSWAEKVLFIGQTVMIFKVDNNKITKSAHLWNKNEAGGLFKREQSLWNEKEHIYLNKLQSLEEDADINISSYDRVIEEIKSYVTARLSEIAVNQADLIKQLKLIKDFYLLGRGELYLEFIRHTNLINKSSSNENMLRDFVKSFERAGHAVGVNEDLEQFSLSLPKASLDTSNTQDFDIFHSLQLQYRINWPLHLLFSPRAIERYNMLFRFLLLIKKIQYELHSIWFQQTKESKSKDDIKVIHLRNELMFFVDNLQYYIQVDVLESQFSIFLSTVLNKVDFEQIQRSHSIFQANVLSLCFLLTDEKSSSVHINNPVYVIINEIFYICNDFFHLINIKKNSGGNQSGKLDELNEKFHCAVEKLINHLVSLKSAPSTNPLSQLLLRLDYNHWFSTKKK